MISATRAGYLQPMKNTLLAALVISGAVLCTGAYQYVAGQPAATSARVPIGAVAAQVAGRLIATSDSAVDIFGYLTFVDGMTDLFKSTPGAAGAHLAFRSEPTGAHFLDNGRVLHLIATPANGQFTRMGVYYQDDPARDLTKPETFAEGTQIASFRTHGTRANVTSTAYLLSATLELEWAIDFQHRGRTFNLRSMGDSVTLQSFGPGATLETLLEQAARDGNVSVDYGGTAYAAGAYPIAGQ